MIKQLKSGNWIVSGAGPLDRGEQGLGIGEGAVLVSNAEMQQFVHEQAQALADRALAILIEHQRHTLLPEQREGEN